MNILDKFFTRFFPPHQTLPTGMYPYMAPPDAEFPYRLHLRIEPDGRGVLIANGCTVMHLNQTAAEYAYHLIKQTPPDEMAKVVAKRYGIKPDTALRDSKDLQDRIRAVVETPDRDPESYLDLRSDPYSVEISAPYRLDCALTYRLPEEGFDRFTPVDRVKRELVETEWKTILKKAWDAGIPHVVFTGGEPTLRPDLPDLIEYASQLGMVTGLITNGDRLAETEYLHKVLQGSLDHLMLILHADEEEAWEAVRDTLAEDLAVTVHLTLTPRDNLEDFTVLDKLAAMGVKSISLSVSDISLTPAVPAFRQAITERNMHLVYDLPVPYSHLHPVALEMAGINEKVPQGAGKAWLYVEPDGDVLPAQGYPEVLGNLLTDSWEDLWKNCTN